MNANIKKTGVNTYQFEAIKFNKQSTIFIGQGSNSYTSFITREVKIEKFQGYSKAYNLAMYFRIRNKDNWSKCEQVTGLWKTEKPGVYYGDRRTLTDKTLLIFVLLDGHQRLSIYEFPKGYYPHRNVIDSIINNL
jgi:hypothetical protein